MALCQVGRVAAIPTSTLPYMTWNQRVFSNYPYPETPVPKCQIASKTVSLGLLTKESSQIALESPYRPTLLMATNSLLVRINLYRVLC